MKPSASRVAVGTVLGASTLPFYSQPETQFVHLKDDMSLREDGKSLRALELSSVQIKLGKRFFELFSGSSQRKRPHDSALGVFRLRKLAYAQSDQLAQICQTTFFEPQNHLQFN